HHVREFGELAGGLRWLLAEVHLADRRLDAREGLPNLADGIAFGIGRVDDDEAILRLETMRRLAAQTCERLRGALLRVILRGGGLGDRSDGRRRLAGRGRGRGRVAQPPAPGVLDLLGQVFTRELLGALQKILPT